MATHDETVCSKGAGGMDHPVVVGGGRVCLEVVAVIDAVDGQRSGVVSLVVLGLYDSCCGDGKAVWC